MSKKNVPYKVSKILWVVLVVFTILNIVGVWLGWQGKESAATYQIPWQVAFGITTGALTLAVLVACAVCAFLNQKVEARVHGWAYSLLAAVHLTFVILTFTLVKGEDYSLPSLFTVFLVVILVVCLYYALAGRKAFQTFGSKSKEQDLAPIRREDLGPNPTESTIDQIANPENNPDRKSGRDEKTGIVSL